MFFEINDKNSKVASYHLEFQTRNDNSMVIRMFEYGFQKAKEKYKQDINDKNLKTIYFPKQKVIFFEKNRNIEDWMNLKIIFPDDQELLYSVDVIKYWELTDEYIIKKKMYPLLPLQLFNLRKELETAHKKNNIGRIKELSYIAKDLATKLAKEAKQLLDEDEILAEDFHKMLLAIQNLIEYLNRNYFNDERIEKEVTTMTKTLFDPEVEKNGEKKKAIEIAKNLLDVLDDKTIASKTGLSVEFIESLRK